MASPVAGLMPAHQRPRRIGQLPALAVAYTFDDPLPDKDIAPWKVIGDSAGSPPSIRRVPD